MSINFLLGFSVYPDFMRKKYPQSHIPRLKITPAIRERLRNEMERTGISPQALLENCPDAPVNSHTVYRWLAGKIQSAEPRHYEYILKKWENLPESDVISFTPKIQAKMKALNKQTGVGIMALLAGQKDLPEGLNSIKANGYYNGKLSKISKSHLEYILKKWKERTKSPLVPLTKEIIALLNENINRTGIGPYKILKGSRLERPDGLNAAIVCTWLEGKRKHVRQDHLDYVLKKYKQASTEPPIEITQDTRSILKTYRKKTGITPHKLLQLSKPVPKKLDASLIRSWITGKVTVAKKEHLEFVLQQWEKLSAGKAEFVEITPELLAVLRDYKDRLGVWASALLKGKQDVPEGLTINVMSGWLEGRTKTLRVSHLEYVLETYRRIDQNNAESGSAHIIQR